MGLRCRTNSDLKETSNQQINLYLKRLQIQFFSFAKTWIFVPVVPAKQMKTTIITNNLQSSTNEIPALTRSSEILN